MIYNESKYNKDWNENKLSDLGVFSRGKSKHRPRNDERLFAGGKYPFIQTGDIKDANLYIKNHTQEYGEFGLKQSKLWNKGTLCITIAANIAETAILSYPACFPDSVVGFNAYESQSSEIFMYYVFEYIKASIQNVASGSVQDNINIDYLTTLNFKIPEKNYQDMIVALLGAIDKKIIFNNDINDNLEQQAKLLYDYWFSQFDFPDKNGKPYCSAGGKMVWNEQLKRNIPENWKVVPLSTVLNFKSGFSFSSDLYVTEGKYKLLTIKNVQDSGINLNVDNYINDVPSNVPDYCFLKVNDILMSLTGNVGRIGIMYDSGCLLNQRVALAKSVNEDLHSFVYFLLKSDIIRKQYETIANGSSQKNLSPVESENVLIAYNEQIAIHFASVTNKHLKIIVSNLAENEKLIHLRDWLLPMLMNGQATISD